MNRIDRVTAILIQLQSRKVVKAQDIADRFGISLRTVYRDINTLEEAGIPVIGEAGVGYSIMDGYRLPPVMFTKEEAIAFLTAEKLVENFTDAATETDYKSAMYKVRSVLRGTEKDLLENIEDHIAVRRSYLPFDNAQVSNTLQLLLRSISEKKVVEIEYQAQGYEQSSVRSIEPVGVFYSGSYWHSIAWCRLRNDYRDFRTDRILKIRQKDEVFDQEHPSLKSYLEKMSRQENLETIVINVDADIVRYLHESKYYYGFVSEKKVKDKVQMTFLSRGAHVFVRWYAMFADHAEVVQPESLRQFLREHVGKISEKI